MKATETNFLQFLKAPKQFVIPIYQRTYSWTLMQCQQLWDDIHRAAQDSTVSGHFVGSIVYIEKGLYQVTSVPHLLVIDGQQRLTTLSLLLAALGNTIEERQIDSDISRRRIYNYFLFNNEETGDLRYKLLLTQSDKETLIKLIEGQELPTPASTRIVENYRFFQEQLRKSSHHLDVIYEGISKLIIVDISLDRDRDNPQLIFESLNSTGLDLSQADLIRNYVLMGLEPKEQADLYNKYWYPMEQSFGHTEYTSQFDRFMRDFLTVRTGRIPNINDVYASFKSYVQSKSTDSIADIVADIYQFSKYFVKLAFQRETDKEINQIFGDINTLKVDVAYPLLLELFDDYTQHRLSRDAFISILKMVESYVFRRAICGIPTNSLNKTFASFASEIDKINYLQSAQAAFLLKDSYKRFPSDEEFRREFVVKDVYNFRSRNYLLRKLENHQRKELVGVESYTIEHIMPQNENLSIAWKQELGQDWEHVHKTYLHTIGNLTLTGYNSELSDRPFVEKRDMEGGFADSPLRLNRTLARLEHWNEAEINTRAAALADLAATVWAAPDLSQDVLTGYQKNKQARTGKVYTLADHNEYLHGHMLNLFEQLRKRILNLDSEVREDIKKLYIAYKTTTNFVDVVPQKNRLRLSLNMRFDQIHDPKRLCTDVTNVGRWGNGDVEVRLSSFEQLDDVMALIRQSFEKHREEGDE